MDQASAFSLSPSPLKIQAGTSFFPPPFLQQYHSPITV